jgi:uridine kinase
VRVGGSTDAVAPLVDALLAGEARLGSTRLVCIDGPAGSGKTTLATSLEAEVRRRRHQVVTLHMDDVYDGWSGLRPDLEPRLLSQVFEPLASGHPARWQRYDWYAHRFAEWAELDLPAVLVVEGCGSGALAYAPYRTLLIWVEADLETRLRRGIERDGPAVLPCWLEWMDLETAHFALNATRDVADVIVSGR